MPDKPIDLTGQRFGRLVADHVASIHPRQGARWSCICDCGTVHVVASSVLRRGKSTSCGCYRSERVRQAYTTHGMRHHPAYKSWCGAHQRCKGATPKTKVAYLDRGIRVCPRWSTFEAFWEDMGPTWQAGLSLDRWPRNDGDYEPGNCRWATHVQQNNNRRKP